MPDCVVYTQRRVNTLLLHMTNIIDWGGLEVHSCEVCNHWSYNALKITMVLGKSSKALDYLHLNGVFYFIICALCQLSYLCMGCAFGACLGVESSIYIQQFILFKVYMG